MITDEKLMGFTDRVCSTLFGFSVTRAHDDAVKNQGHSFRTGCISIAGEEKYALYISVSEVLVKKMAAAMLCMEENELSNADVKDVLGETCNIIGGEVKADFGEGDFHLGLPVVADGPDQNLSIPQTVVDAHVEMMGDGLPIVVVLHVLKSR